MTFPVQLGSDTAQEMPAIKTWKFFDGEGQTIEIHGPRAAVQQMYDSYKAVAGSSPDIDALSYDPGKGVARMLVQKIEDGEACYELFSNDFFKPVENSDLFTYGTYALTTDEVVAVKKAIATGADSASLSLSTAQQILYNHLALGETEYFTSGYVLRVSQIVSKRSTKTAAYTDVNRVDPAGPPNVAAVNSLIGDIPDGEWLKKSPTVTMVGAKRWRIEQEWWWSEQWSVVYGGTLFAP